MWWLLAEGSVASQRTWALALGGALALAKVLVFLVTSCQLCDCGAVLALLCGCGPEEVSGGLILSWRPGCGG